MPRRKRAVQSLSILSSGIFDVAFMLLERDALPIYKKNINARQKGIAGGENVASAIAILLLNTGLDHHLSRLKYLRDIHPHSPPLRYTPYFNWKIADYLPKKIFSLLIKRNEKRLNEQLLELTTIRDCIIHPKVYAIKETFGSDDKLKTRRGELAPGSELKQKAIQHKRKRSENSKLLKLPFVPTWISYPDAVLCVLVLHRFLNLLKQRYGNYAEIGASFARSHTHSFALLIGRKGYSWRKCTTS